MMDTIKDCRVCHNPKLIDLMSLGDQYLSDFREDDIKPPKFPLNLVFCQECFLVQLRETTPQSEMYTPRYGFKSGVNDTIKANLKEIVEECLVLKPDAESWLDIASNDGTLLSFVPITIYTAGIDPIKKYCDEAKEHNLADLILNAYFKPEYLNWKQFDVITSISCFYDMPDPNEFVAGVKSCLKDDGVWSIQQNYLLTTLELNAVDNICHEHLEYYSLLSMNSLLERHGLEVFRVETNMINGGCIRTLVCHKGARPIEHSVYKQLRIEYQFGLDTDAPYKKFVSRVWDTMDKLKQMVVDINERGEKVYIYGASTRGGTIWQMAGLDVKLIPKAVERNPEKVGKKIASIGVPIISEEEAREDKPEYMLVSIWFFKDEILAREREYLLNGGKLIFPFPTLEVYDAKRIS